MSFEANVFLSMMPSTIKISTRSGHNNYGEPTFASTTTNFRARIVERREFMRTATGEVLEQTHVIWCRSTGATSITTDDRLTMPDGTTPQMLSVEMYPDEDLEHHRKIIVGHSG
jgi:hypothetical protein